MTLGVQGVRFRIYADTSVIGGCFDPEFEEASRKLFDLFINAVNTGLGYQELEIRTPREIVYGET